MIPPAEGAEVFVHADLPRQPAAGGVARDDEGEMPRLSDDGVALVGTALGVVTGMDMDVRHHGAASLAAVLPDGAELPPIEFHDAVRETGRIDVVVEKKLLDATRPLANRAEKKRAALPPAPCTPPQLVDPAMPDLRRAEQSGRSVPALRIAAFEVRRPCKSSIMNAKSRFGCQARSGNSLE